MKIDAEFKGLIFPLAEAEAAMLEESLKREGCRDALVTWHGLLLDGHHRLEICRRRGIEFRTAEIDLEDRAAAKVWVIKNQFARRNLTPFQRAELALKLEPLIAARAKERQRGGRGGVLLPPNSAKAIDTREEIASIAGLSHETIERVRFILRRGSEEAKENLRKGETTINFEYKMLADISTAAGVELHVECLEIGREWEDLDKRSDLLMKEKNCPRDRMIEMLKEFVKFIRKCERHQNEAAEFSIRIELELGKALNELEKRWPEYYAAFTSGTKKGRQRCKELLDALDEKIKVLQKIDMDGGEIGRTA